MQQRCGVYFSSSRSVVRCIFCCPSELASQLQRYMLTILVGCLGVCAHLIERLDALGVTTLRCPVKSVFYAYTKVSVLKIKAHKVTAFLLACSRRTPVFEKGHILSRAQRDAFDASRTDYGSEESAEAFRRSYMGALLVVQRLPTTRTQSEENARCHADIPFAI